MAIVLVFYTVMRCELKSKAALKIYPTLVTERFIYTGSYI
jgi:hypothetical protein